MCVNKKLYLCEPDLFETKKNHLTVCQKNKKQKQKQLRLV